jgi:trk system potassium uptake protein TrkH
MNIAVVQKIIGILLMLFSSTMLPPLLVSLLYRDGNWRPFIESFVIILSIGALCWWPQRMTARELRHRDGFLIVSLFWCVLGVAGATPMLLSDAPSMTFTDAVFESISGFTTTGATVLTGLDSMAPSFLYFRQQIHWFGGIGIVVLAVALLPMLGIGGMQLVKAETPGPVKDTKLTPRITETAKAL